MPDERDNPVDTLRNSEIVATIRDGLLVLTDDLTVEFANPGFLTLFGVSAEETVGRKLYELGNGEWAIPSLRRLLEELIPLRNTVEAYDIDHVFERVGRRVIRLNARKTVRPGNGSRRILLAFDDVTAASDAGREAERQRRLAQGIVDTVREPLLVLDGDLRVVAASRSFSTAFGVSLAETVGSRLPDLGNGQWNIPRLLELLGRVIPDHSTVEDFEIDHDFPVIGRRQMLLNARKIFREGNNTKTFLLAMEDVTDRRRLEAERTAALEQARLLLDELTHRVMNSLAIISSIIAMESRRLGDDACRAAFERMQRRVVSLSQLYRALSQSGSADQVGADRFLAAIADGLMTSLGDGAARPVALKLDIQSVPLSTGVAVPLGLVVNELLTNSLKYAFVSQDSGELSVTLGATADGLVLSIADNGRGIDPAARADSGLGGRLVDAFAQQLEGRLERDSGSAGTTVRLYFDPAR